MPVVAPQTREEILAAALRCYARRGVLATTIEDVRAESGASVGSLYHWFGGKRAIAAAVYADGLARYQSAFLDELASHVEPEAGVKAIVGFHLDWCIANPDLARFLAAPRDDRLTDASRDAVTALNREFFAAARSWLATHVDAGAIRETDLEVTHALWLGPAQEYLRHWLSRGSSPLPPRARRALADAAWAALKAPDEKEPR